MSRHIFTHKSLPKVNYFNVTANAKLIVSKLPSFQQSLTCLLITLTSMLSSYREVMLDALKICQVSACFSLTRTRFQLGNSAVRLASKEAESPCHLFYSIGGG